MNQFAKLALLLAVALGMASASAFTYQEQKAVNDNWGNGSRELVWKNGTNELCWRNSVWTPATANSSCDGAIMAQIAPPVVERAPEQLAPQIAPVVPTVTTEKVTYSADALFDFDKAVLKTEGKSKLNELHRKLEGVIVEVIVATGHTDSIGSSAYNQKLSLRRAKAVKDYLVSQGIDGKHIFTEGKGSTQSVASNKTAAGRAKNRRVEIEVVGKREVTK